LIPCQITPASGHRQPARGAVDQPGQVERARLAGAVGQERRDAHTEQPGDRGLERLTPDDAPTSDRDAADEGRDDGRTQVEKQVRNDEDDDRDRRGDDPGDAAHLLQHRRAHGTGIRSGVRQLRGHVA
jgi:hypothetical protein